jgi:Flp pilus assembly protein TadD
VSDDAEYHDLLASAQLSSRDYAGAIISYSGLVQYDGSQGKWWYGFAAAHDQLGNVALARQAYSRAMQYSNLSANLRRRSQERLGALNL